jgi:hypothetical protein
MSAQNDSLRFHAHLTDSLVTALDSVKTAAPDTSIVTDVLTDSLKGQTINDVLGSDVYSAQSELAIVDDLSYRHYLNSDWKTLTQYCSLQFAKGIDYFYLRMRAGVAAYEQKHYREAVVHFTKALAFNNNDDIAKEYLYYSFLYTDRFDEALQLRSQFGLPLLTKLGNTSRSLLLSLSSESGLKSTRRPEFDNALFTQLQLHHNLAGKVSLFHSASFFTQHEQRFRVEQAQYYLRASIPVKKGWSLQMSGHLVNMDLTLREDYTAYSVLSYTTNQQLGGIKTQTVLVATPSTTSIPQQSQNYLVAAAVTKEMRWCAASIGGTYAKLDTASQVQANFGLSVFPLQNNHLVIGANGYYHSEDGRAPTFAYSPFFILRPSKRLYLSGSWFNNTGNNISEYNAQLVTNSIDYTRQRISSSLWLGLRPNIWLNFNVGYETKTHFTKKYTYAYYIYSAGFKLTFN